MARGELQEVILFNDVLSYVYADTQSTKVALESFSADVLDDSLFCGERRS